MNERQILIREIAQHLRQIADKIEQNQSNSSLFKHFNLFMYCYNIYFNYK